MSFKAPADGLEPAGLLVNPTGLNLTHVPMSKMGFRTFIWKVRNNFPNVVGRNQRPWAGLGGWLFSHGCLPVLDGPFTSGWVSPWPVFTMCPRCISGFVPVGNRIKPFYKNNILGHLSGSVG